MRQNEGLLRQGLLVYIQRQSMGIRKKMVYSAITVCVILGAVEVTLFKGCDSQLGSKIKQGLKIQEHMSEVVSSLLVS